MRRIRLLTLLSAALACALAGPAAVQAKKGGKTATASASNVPIATATAPAGFVRTDVPLRIGNKFKGRVAGKVEITTQVTGSIANYLDEVELDLISPQGRRIGLQAPPNTNFTSDQAYGPMTETPDSPRFPCSSVDACASPDAVGPPFAATVGNLGLADFFGARVKGTWILRIFDSDPAGTGVLNLARLRIKPAKPAP